jgi:signal peptidase II
VVFGIAAAVAVSALFFLFYQGRGGSLFAWSVPLVASGALGNLIDRVRYGYVVDFIHVHYEPWDFDYPTFNVADITITIGVILLVIDSFRAEPAPVEAPPADVTKDAREASAPSTTSEPAETTGASETTNDEPAADEREPAATDPERA